MQDPDNDVVAQLRRKADALDALVTDTQRQLQDTRLRLSIAETMQQQHERQRPHLDIIRPTSDHEP